VIEAQAFWFMGIAAAIGLVNLILGLFGMKLKTASLAATAIVELLVIAQLFVAIFVLAGGAKTTGSIFEFFGYLLVALLVYLAAGWRAIIFAAITAQTAQLLVAAIDYVEHWGLQRRLIDGKPERMGPQHTWDCANRVSDALLFNLPRHSAHHLEPSLDCNAMYRISASPQMPTGYAGMTILAVLSPLFRAIMTPRLPDDEAARVIFPAQESSLATGEHG
jgi:hypothetical protein